MKMLKCFHTPDVIEAGCDEAGRGCLAGPVFAAAVILPEGFYNAVLNDSKQLTERQRYELRDVIEREAVAWAVAECSPQEIDKMNILRCSIIAMQRAVEKLKVRPQHLIIDGNQLKNAVKGKAITVDTSKNAYMRNLRNTLLNCITGNYEAAAKENDANLVVEEKGGIKTVTIMARKQAVKGYSRIIMDYDKKGRPVRMVLDEFTGIETEYTFKY